MADASPRPDSYRGAHRTERSLLAVCSLGAAAIHFAVAPEHFAEYWLFGLAFTATGWFQALWAAVWAYAPRPGRTLAALAIAVNAGTLLVWAWSRSAGLPIGAEPGVPEPVGVADLVADALELVLIAGIAVTTWTPSGLARLRGGGAGLHALRVLLAAAAIVATGYAIATLAPPTGGMG